MSLFQNHEIFKILGSNLFVDSLLIYLTLIILSRIKLTRCTDSSFLNINITEQVRGIAILLVVVGHIGAHTLTTNVTWLNIADYGVATFFFLSGFGLAISHYNSELVLSNFLIKRFSRVLIPYIIATIIILLLDFILLNRTYTPSNIVLTLVGLNISETTRHIDYVRWYITLLFIWYFIFPFLFRHFKTVNLSIIFLFAGIILFIINYYIIPIGYAIMSFPFGIINGILYSNISHYLNKIKSYSLIVSLITFSLIFCIDNSIFSIIQNYVPYIFLAFAQELLWALFPINLFLFLYSFPSFTSPFLKFIGKYSYEIFLFHGVFMIKYDFILFRAPLYLSFWPYLLLIIIMSIIMRKFIFDKIQARNFKYS